MQFINRSLSLKTKITLTIVVSAIILGIVVTGVSATFLLSSYQDIENSQIEKDILRTNAAIENSFTSLEVAAVDWGHWDDTYFFVQDLNEKYIDANLDDSTLVNLGVNYILYVDTEGRALYSKLVDLETGSEIPNAQVTNKVLAHEELISHPDYSSLVSGIVSVPAGLLMVGSSPIVTSKEDSSVVGSLIFGRYIDAEKISNFRELAQHSLEIFRYNDPSSPEDIATAQTALADGTDFTSNTLTRDTLAGYTIIRDLDEKPAAILRVKINRDIYDNGLRTLVIFVLTTSMAILLIALLTSILSEKLLVSRFTLLAKQIEEISTTKNIALRVTEGKQDEIGRFARIINTLLDGLSKARKTERELQKREKEVAKKLAERLAEIENFNKMMIGRELKMIELKNENKRLRSEQEKD